MRYLAFILIFLALYLALPLPLLGNWYVPNLPALLLALLVFPTARQHVPRIVIVLTLLAAYCVLNALFATSEVTPPVERIKGSLQLLYFSGLSLLIANSQLFRFPADRRWLGWMFLFLGLSMVAGGYLEDSTPIGQLSDRFRAFMYAGGSLYEADQRDLILTSGIRPKLFASEPAHAALGTAVCLTLGGICLMQVAPLVVAAIGCTLAAKVFGSPIPLAFAITLLVGGAPAWRHQRSSGITWRILFTQVTAIVVGVLFIILAVSFIDTLQTRFLMALDGKDRSSYLRLFHIMFVAGDAMMLNPLFGVGIGGELEVAQSLFLEGYENAKANTLLNNPIWTVPLFGGVTASLVALLALGKAVMQLSPHQRVLFGLFVGSVMLSGGSIVNTPSWITGGIVFAALRGIDQNAVEQREKATVSTDAEYIPPRSLKGRI